jgi:hypothetical protein
MKDVMIVSFQGIVRINNAPQNARRSELIEHARYLLSNKFTCGLTGLANLEYLVNNEIFERLENNFGDASETPDDYYDFEVEWEDIK